MVERLERVAEGVRERLRKAQAGRPVLLLYEDAAIHLLVENQAGRWRFYHEFLNDRHLHGQEQNRPAICRQVAAVINRLRLTRPLASAHDRISPGARGGAACN